MASYHYTRDMTEEEMAPPEVHVYTKKELWANWWDYNLKWVIVGTIALALAVYFILDVYVLTPDIDYQIAIVAPVSVSTTVTDAMSEVLTPYLPDVTGDGKTTVTVYSYYVDLSSYNTDSSVDDALTEEVEEEPALTDEELEEQYSDYSYTSGTEDYYLAMAGQVQLAADLEVGDTTIFILYDPENFQAYTEMLTYADGTLPQDPTTVAWEELVYEFSDCGIFGEDILTALDGYYIARRSSTTNQDIIDQVGFYQELWDLLIGDASTYAENIA